MTSMTSAAEPPTSLDYFRVTLQRIEDKIADQDRRLEAIIDVLPFPYRHKIREALSNGRQDPGPDAHPRRTAARAAIIGPRTHA